MDRYTMKIVLAGIESVGDKSSPGSEALSRLRSRYDVHRVYARAGAPVFFHFENRIFRFSGRENFSIFKTAIFLTIFSIWIPPPGWGMFSVGFDG